MGLIQEIAQAAGIRLVELGALQLVSAADFLSFVAACEDREVAIVGMEGFRLRMGAAVSDMDAIADFSEMKNENWASASAQEAKRFFTQIQPAGMMFDFVLHEKAGRA